MRMFPNRYVSVVLALPLALSALPVWAEEADKGGLPQFDTSLFVEQLFWLALSFSILYFLMSRVALPRVAETQSNRKHMIASEIDAARVANDAAKAAVALVEKSLSEARANAQASVSEMMTKVTQEAAQRQSVQEKELVRHLRIAEEEIAVTREAALYAIGAGSAELANLVVEKILHSKGRVSA